MFDFTADKLCDAFQDSGGDLLELGVGADGRSYQIVLDDLAAAFTGTSTGVHFDEPSWVITRGNALLKDDDGRLWVYSALKYAAQDAALIMAGQSPRHEGATPVGPELEVTDG